MTDYKYFSLAINSNVERMYIFNIYNDDYFVLMHYFTFDNSVLFTDKLNKRFSGFIS